MIEQEEVLPVVGANIRRLREAAGWSQDHLAKLLNVSRVTLNRVENAHSDPTLRMAYTLADLFGVPTDTFRQVVRKKVGSAS